MAAWRCGARPEGPLGALWESGSSPSSVVPGEMRARLNGIPKRNLWLASSGQDASLYSAKTNAIQIALLGLPGKRIALLGRTGGHARLGY